jgi:hypothetical protein
MITVLKQGSNYLANGEGVYTEYVCSTIADVQNLPTGKGLNTIDRPRPGSTAIVTSISAVYVLSNEREWVALVEG